MDQRESTKKTDAALFAALCLAAALSPVIFWTGFGGFLTVKAQIVQVLAVAAGSLLLYKRLFLAGAARRPVAADRTALLFSGAAAISLFWCGSARLGVQDVILFASYSTFYFVAADAASSPGRLRGLSAVMLASMAVNAALVFQQRYASHLPILTGRSFDVTGLLGNPIYVGEHLLLAAPIAAGAALTAGRKTQSAFFWILCALGAVALLISGARGALVGLLLSAALFGALHMGRPFMGLKKNRPALLLTAGLACLCVALFIASLALEGGPRDRPNAVRRLLTSFTSESHSAQQRRVIWGSAWRMAADHPILGVGVGNLPYFNPEYQKRFFETKENLRYAGSVSEKTATRAHNDFLQFIAEYGLPGWAVSASLLAAAALCIRLLIERSRREDREGFPLAAGFAAGAAGMLVDAFFNFPFRVAPNGLWFFVGLGAAVGWANNGESGPARIRAASGGVRSAAAAGLAALCAFAVFLSAARLLAEADLAQGQALLELKRPLEAERRLALAFQRAPTLGYAAYLEGLALNKQNEILRAATDLDPQDRTEAIQANARAALERFDKAARTFSGDALHFQRGQSALLLEDLKTARREFEEAVAINPAYGPYRDQINLLYAFEQENEKLLESARAAETLEGASAPEFNNLGLAAVRVGRLDEAIQSFNKALKIDPDFPPAHNNLGVALARQGKGGQARGAFARAVELDPGYVDAWCNLGALFLKLNDRFQAAENYQKALDLAPGHPEANYRMALIHYLNGEIEKALPYAEKALENRARGAESLLKKIHEKLGDKEG